MTYRGIGCRPISRMSLANPTVLKMQETPNRKSSSEPRGTVFQ
jgi:hypothetical protein